MRNMALQKSARIPATNDRMWKLSGISWKDLAKRIWVEIKRDDVFGDAAKLAYYLG